MKTVAFVLSSLALQIWCAGTSARIISTPASTGYGNGFFQVSPNVYPLPAFQPNIAIENDDTDLDIVLPLIVAMMASKQSNCERCYQPPQNIPVPFPIPIPINSPIINGRRQPDTPNLNGPLTNRKEFPCDEAPIKLQKGDAVVSYDSGLRQVCGPDGEIENIPIPYTGEGPLRRRVYVCNCDEPACDEPACDKPACDEPA